MGPANILKNGKYYFKEVKKYYFMEIIKFTCLLVCKLFVLEYLHTLHFYYFPKVVKCNYVKVGKNYLPIIRQYYCVTVLK